jgi:hypothetical protein
MLAASAWLVFADESAVSLIPPVHRTWSPRGRTPILRHRFGQPSYDTDSLIGVLEQLAGFYAGHRVVLVWDGLSAHWSTKMRAWLDSQRDWLTAERLPA